MLSQWRSKIRKPLLFGLCGAIGCLITATVGEVFLELTKKNQSQAILMVIDTSLSMEGEKLTNVKQAATNFIQQQDLTNNQIAIVSFGDDASIQIPLTSDKNKLNQAIDNLSANGGTNMQEGIEKATQELLKSNGSPHILLFSDGKPGEQIIPKDLVLLIDNSGSMQGEKLAEVQQAAKNFINRRDLTINRLAIASFANDGKLIASLTNDKNKLNQAIDNLSADGGTRMDLGIQKAVAELSKTTNKEVRDKQILLFTDGQPAPQPPSPEVDIMFVLDITSSMKEEIKGVQTGIQTFAQQLDNKKIDSRIGLIAFGDRFEGEEPQILAFGGSNFTRDTNSFSSQVGNLKLLHGGDHPESSFDALALASRQSFRSSATKVMVLITDDIPKIPDREIKSQTEIANILQSNNIEQLHLVIKEKDRSVYEDLQKVAQGETFLISETSRRGGGFETILTSLGEEIAETSLQIEDRQPIIDATKTEAEKAREANIKIVSVGTGDAEERFLSQLTDDPNFVFYADSGELDQAFKKAETLITGDRGEKAIADTIKTSQQARNKKITIVAVGTDEAKADFLEQITGDTNLVFYTDSDNLEQAFTQAGEKIRQLIDPNDAGNYTLIYSLYRNGVWTVIIGVGASIALIVGQNQYQRRRLLSIKEGIFGITGSVVAGIIAGGLGQFAFSAIVENVTITALVVGGEIIIGWSILGLLLGFGLSFVVPNLPKTKGLTGGVIGGVIGGVSFIFLNSINPLAGRLAGSAILGFTIGMMIALLEALSKDARLIIHWSANEKREILLGNRPIVLGYSDSADVYLRKDQGYFPVTARILKENEQIIMQFDREYVQSKGIKVDRQVLKDGAKRKLGDVTLEIQLFSSNKKSE